MKFQQKQLPCAQIGVFYPKHRCHNLGMIIGSGNIVTP